jgi:hypothetical protein
MPSSDRPGAELPRVDEAALAGHVATETPCVIAGGARTWPAAQRWTIEYLDARIGDREIRCKRSRSHVHPDFRATSIKEMFATEATTFRALFAAIAAGDATRLFTGDEQFVLRRRDGVTTVHEPFRALLDDVVVPAIISPEQLYTVWAWFSGRGVHTWLHYDNNGCHNLNAQLAGSKTCVLYPPSELDRMALFPVGGANPAVNCSSLDLDANGPPPGGYTARLEAGDLLFIPAWWFHAFDHHGAFNANVNFWWKPAHPTENPVSRRQEAIDGRGRP